MSSADIETSSDTTVKKQRTISWFRRRRRPFFGRFSRCGSSKKRGQSSSSSFEALSTTSGQSPKADVPSTESTSSAGGTSASTKNDFQSVEETSVTVETNTTSIECPLCLIPQPFENFPVLSTCHHRSCFNCLRQYLSIEISESRVNLMCPECQEKLHPSDMRFILENEPHLMVKWEEFTLRRTLSIDPDCRWCPAPDCGYAVIAYGCASCPRLHCQRPGCNTEFCYHCRQEWHHNQTCDSAHLQRTRQLRIRSNSAAHSQGSTFHDEIKPCPKCGALIVKMNDGSCNHMTCTVCEAEFCWLCLQEITDLHYLSPSGCTFWGKKPWSRKKKILWQLGLLIGAPLGIGLVAGVAVPAIIFGLPIWVAKRIIAQFENTDVAKYKRNLVVATCVAGSIVLSPALAALAVGVGVPVMLVYVYGVVPFSLCRTGSYGLRGDRDFSTPGNSMLPASFRLDLGGSSGQAGPSSPEDGTSFHSQPSRLGPINPSIGEASVGGMTMGSLNTSRGSNMDKVGRNDHDGASTVAMAGTSITGSLSGISGAGPLGSNRIEVHAKDTDQQSTHTQASVGSAPLLTSVQVHANDNVSEHSTSSFSPSAATSGSTVKKSYSTKTIGAKRKTKHAKRSSSIKTSSASNRDEDSGLPVTDSNLATMAAKQDPMSSLTVVNEREPRSDDIPSTSAIVPATSDDRSDSSSCGSQSRLLHASMEMGAIKLPDGATVDVVFV